MKSVVIPALLAVALAAAGFMFWTVGKEEQRLADAHRALTVLQYADASARAEATDVRPLVQRVASLGGDGQLDGRHVRATADYWDGQYAVLEPKRDAGGAIIETDPQVLLLAANASFRASQGDVDRVSAMRKLDGVVKNYGEVLKHPSAPDDAAYNYEYAVRARDVLAKARSASAKTASAKAALDARDALDSDLPSGSSLHGHAGGPPAKTDMSQFKIVIPKRGEERKDDPQAGKGNIKVRKG
jgi:hypothetical protein